MKAVQMMMMRKAEKRVYGYLYNWYVVDIIAATGWSVPTDAEWTDLTTLLGGESVAGGKLKSTRTAPLAHPRWASPNTGATDEVNFSALPAGYRSANGTFIYLGDYGFWWSFTEYNTSNVWNIFITSIVTRSYNNKKAGFSIRLVRSLQIGESSLADGTYVADYVGNDGKKYKAVKIGTLVWTAENLAETKYQNGDPIPNVTDATEWSELTTGARCAYDNDESYV
jgi:uncharacterized protein (TIGR02145 family)